MKKSILWAPVLALLFTVFGFSSPALALDPTLKQLAPNTLFERFWNDVEKIESGEFEGIISVNYYKNINDKKPYAYISYNHVKSSFNSMESSDSLLEENYQEESAVAMDLIISQDENLLLRFPKTNNRNVKNKWMQVPEGQYEKLGKALDQYDFFEFALSQSTEEEDEFFEQELALSKKHNLFGFFPGTIEDNRKIKNATRFDFQYNPKSITAYYNELKKPANAELMEESILLPLPEDVILDKQLIDYISSTSYISVWFDDKTSLPTGMLLNFIVPVKDGGIIYVVMTTSHGKINQPITIKKPTKFLDFEQSLKTLGINPEGFIKSLSPEEQKIKNLLSDFESNKKKDQKALIGLSLAGEYSEQGKTEDASKYYKIAADNFKKETASYYYSLARAELALGNGLKAKEYLEKAYTKNPNDLLVLNSYGLYLLGISKTSYINQNLLLAQKINESLVEKLVDDSNLIQLYINYILLGDTTKAEAIKSRFDNFNTWKNYSSIARAYHRMGNTGQRDKYIKMAKDAGYKQDKVDDDFFALSFK